MYRPTGRPCKANGEFDFSANRYNAHAKHVPKVLLGTEKETA